MVRYYLDLLFSAKLLIIPFMLRRPRRLRYTEAIRSLVQETHLLPSDLVAPLFVREGQNEKESIKSLPGSDRLSIDLLLKEAAALQELGLRAIALFPVIDKKLKDPSGSYALQEDGLAPRAIAALKREFPDLCIITDIALDPYTSHGHDGLINDAGYVLNDETIILLTEMAKIQAAAGADIVAPSDMMDGRVSAIRQSLDSAHFHNVLIMAYTAKYASSLYHPFRDALSSSLAFGNKKSYQMDPANRREALVEARLDEDEGADMLMVKPAGFYLDVIAALRASTSLPIAAYQVSGEYAMMQAAAQNGWLSIEAVLLESLTSIKRAGADIILTYGAKTALEALQ